MSSFEAKYLDALFLWNTKNLDARFEDGARGEKIELNLQELFQKDLLALNVINYSLKYSEAIISKYSPQQYAAGLEFIFNNSFSDLSFVISESCAEWELDLRIETINALQGAFNNLFGGYAEPVLGHLDHSLSDRNNRVINNVCYMFWDTTPLLITPHRDVFSACLDVMEKCSKSTHPAVVEHALHGLGHAFGAFNGDFDADIKRRALAANVSHPAYGPHLYQYAQSAAAGRVL